MQIKTEALIISATRYQEKSLIVKAYTKVYGLRTYFVRNAFSKTNKTLNSSYFQPLTNVLLDATHKNKGTLEYINEVKLVQPYQSISFDFYKNTVAIFLAEVLGNAIKEDEANIKLYTFITTALTWFDQHEFNPNFHLWFLLNTTKYLGFYPDDSDEDSLYFNLIEGSFTNDYSPNCFNEMETIAFRKLFELSLNTIKPVGFNSQSRKIVLKQLLNYYGIHIANFKNIKSLDVLSEIIQ